MIQILNRTEFNIGIIDHVDHNLLPIVANHVTHIFDIPEFQFVYSVKIWHSEGSQEDTWCQYQGWF